MGMGEGAGAGMGTDMGEGSSAGTGMGTDMGEGSSAGAGTGMGAGTGAGASGRRPVVVVDSGLGGISVLKRLVEAMPNEEFVYFGDSANAPYGPRPADEVRRLTIGCLSRFDTYNPKAIVIACNTATAAARTDLVRRYPRIPVVGIEPAVRRAARENPRGHILSLATAGTLASDPYRRQLREVGELGHVVSVAAPGIVTYVEGGMADRAEVVLYLRKLLNPWAATRFDGVVLGCTHFPFAASEIQEALGYPVRFYEPSADVALRVRRNLIANGTAAPRDAPGSVTIMNSADRFATARSGTGRPDSDRASMLGFSWRLFTEAPVVSPTAR